MDALFCFALIPIIGIFWFWKITRNKCEILEEKGGAPNVNNPYLNHAVQVDVDFNIPEVRIRPLKQSGRLRFTVQLNRYNQFSGDSYMSIILTDSQQVAVPVTAVSAAGNPAQLEAGSLVVVSSNDAVATVVVGLEGFDVVTTGVLGTAQVVVTADADLGEGVVTLTGILDVEVIAGQAVALALNPGAPTEKVVE